MIVLARNHNLNGVVWYTVERDGARLHKGQDYLEARRVAMQAAGGQSPVEDRSAGTVVRWVPKGGSLVREGPPPARPAEDAAGRLTVQRDGGRTLVRLPPPGARAVHVVLCLILGGLGIASCAGGGVVTVSLASTLGPGAALVAALTGACALIFVGLSVWIGLHALFGRQELVVDGDHVTVHRIHPLRTLRETVPRSGIADVVETDPVAEGDRSQLNSSVLLRGDEVWVRVGQGLSPEERGWLAAVVGHAVLG